MSKLVGPSQKNSNEVNFRAPLDSYIIYMLACCLLVKVPVVDLRRDSNSCRYISVSEVFRCCVN